SAAPCEGASPPRGDLRFPQSPGPVCRSRRLARLEQLATLVAELVAVRVVATALQAAHHRRGSASSTRGEGIQATIGAAVGRCQVQQASRLAKFPIRRATLPNQANEPHSYSWSPRIT